MNKTRRNVLAGALTGAGLLAGVKYIPAIVTSKSKPRRKIDGGFIGEIAKTGHRIRSGEVPAPQKTQKIGVVIVGAGVAGLSSAWRFKNKGMTDYIVLELGDRPGGTSAYEDSNPVSKHPRAAHYIPVPNAEAKFEREMFFELGLLNPDGSWNTQYICRQPQERIFMRGEWHEGILPLAGASKTDEDQFTKFYYLIDKLRDTKDFTIPVTDNAHLVDLDRMTMAQWMLSQGLTSKYLLDYVDYAMRDDYGAKIGEVSAWAGVHYFACREDTEDRVFTWPEGNGWVINELMKRVGDKVKLNTPVFKIRKQGLRYEVITEEVRYIADAVIWAGPTFIGARVIEGFEPLEKSVWQSSPWMTTALTLKHIPEHSRGFKLCWDNVIYGSPSLGYVVDNHQSGVSKNGPVVISHYWALADGSPEQNRIWLLSQSWEALSEKVLLDLETAHPDIRDLVTRVDIHRMGHAMARPVPGAIFSSQRRRFSRQDGRLVLACTDLSGFNIFEEAQYFGVNGADQILLSLA